MVKYCAVALCRNGSKKRPDLSYFSFPLSLKDRKKWEVFCKRGDKKFNTLSDPRICSVHLKKTDIETSISGRKMSVQAAIPLSLTLLHRRRRTVRVRGVLTIERDGHALLINQEIQEIRRIQEILCKKPQLKGHHRELR